MPVFNRDYVIGHAIASALAQTHGDLELLVVDDASTDRTAEVVSEYRDPRVRYYRQPRNGGVAAARNAALRQARGEFISFLDSDDVWKPHKLSDELSFLERHPEVHAVFADLEKTDGPLHSRSFIRQTRYLAKMLAARNFPPEVVFSQREIYLCLLREIPIKPTALTMRGAPVRQTGFFDEGWPSGEDREYLLRFAKNFRFGYIDRPLAVYRVQRDATHRRYVRENTSLIISLFKQMIAEAGSDKEILAGAKEGYADASKRLSWAYLAAGEKKAASRTLVRAFYYTGSVGMLARALLALLPSRLRVGLKRFAGRSND